MHAQSLVIRVVDVWDELSRVARPDRGLVDVEVLDRRGAAVQVEQSGSVDRKVGGDLGLSAIVL